MEKQLSYWFTFVLACAITSCSINPNENTLPMGEIVHPLDNPFSAEVAELGRKLFFDKRLSPNNQVSCASCHVPEKGFTDGRSISLGFENRNGNRNSPSLLNIGYHPYFMLDGGVPTLEMQALDPLRDSAEMNNDIGELVEKLKGIDVYNLAAKKLFQREFDAFVLTRALASFQRTLISQNSPFDQWFYQGDENALSESAKRGFEIFKNLECISCHQLPAFTSFEIVNNGSQRTYADAGRYELTGDSSDIGAFKIPSLRNVSITAPYMHNGEYKTLEQVINNYIQGGQNHPNQDPRIKPLVVTDKEKNDLILFLNVLTDTAYVQEFKSMK